MFNFYKYLFLFIINLSLAVKIDSCSIFSQKGVYTLNEAIIGKNLFQDIIIEIQEPAYKENTVIEKDTAHISYTLDGIVKYKENHENKEIKFFLCIDFINNINPHKAEIIYLTDYNSENEKMPITITNSIVTNNEIKLNEPDDPALNPVAATITLNQESSEKLLGQKRLVEDDGGQSYQNKKILKPIDISGCAVLKPGKYSLSDQEGFYIQILSSTYSGQLHAYKVEGILVYDDFFSVPIFKCKSTDNDLIFSLARSSTSAAIDNGRFGNSRSIDYAVHKNRFIDKNYTNTKLSSSLTYDQSFGNIGCTILYKDYSKNKKVFSLKNNVTINVKYTKILTKNLSSSNKFPINGTIKIRGKENLFYKCVRRYDNSIENNDSEIPYYESRGHKKPSHYFFSILDFLPPLTS